MSKVKDLQKGQIVEVDGVKGMVINTSSDTVHIQIGRSVRIIWKDKAGWNRNVKVVK